MDDTFAYSLNYSTKDGNYLWIILKKSKLSNKEPVLFWGYEIAWPGMG